MRIGESKLRELQKYRRTARCLVAISAMLGCDLRNPSPLFAQKPGPVETAIHEGFAQLPGARLFYRDTGGSGVPVILLHAATGTSDCWDYQIPAFRAAGYRVIAYDRRGWGRTELDPAEPQISMAADDLLGLLDY